MITMLPPAVKLSPAVAHAVRETLTTFKILSATADHDSEDYLDYEFEVMEFVETIMMNNRTNLSNHDYLCAGLMDSGEIDVSFVERSTGAVVRLIAKE